MLVVVAIVMIAALSCKAKYGCPSDGRNVGAERLLGEDKKTQKLAKKAGKYKMGKTIPQ